MSILAAARPPGTDVIDRSAIGSLIAITFSLIVAAAAGMFRGRSLRTRGRLCWARVPWALLLLFGIAATAWVLASMAYGSRRAYQVAAESGGRVKFDESMFTSADLAVLATVPPLVGLAVLLAGDLLFLRPFLTFRVGASRRQLARGMVVATFAMIGWVPLVGGVSILSEKVYALIGWEHPPEHQLLRALGHSKQPWVMIALVIGAVVIAPLWEELLFRGHLQTLLRAWFDRSWRTAPLENDPVVHELAGPESAARESAEIDRTVAAGSITAPPPFPEPEDGAILSYQPGQAARTVLSYQPFPAPVAGPLKALPAWIAILLTSAMFAAVHPRWTWPAIFCLAVCLGWVYERTGNLWACIMLHSLFNAASTALYLHGAHH